MKRQTPWTWLTEGLGSALRESLIVVALAAVVGLSANRFFNPNGIPLIAEKAYETIVPCPEPGGPVTPMEAPESLAAEGKHFWIDARPLADFEAWHIPQAVNVTYDYLDPTPHHVIREITREIARSRAQRVIVYGDGEDPDTGEQLAREISGKGIRNVFFVQGGAPGLRAYLGESE